MIDWEDVFWMQMAWIEYDRDDVFLNADCTDFEDGCKHLFNNLNQELK